MPDDRALRMLLTLRAWVAGVEIAGWASGFIVGRVRRTVTAVDDRDWVLQVGSAVGFGALRTAPSPG
jgi:hypothetical protein